MPEFATCTYQEYTPDMGVPLRTTVGGVRFPISYREQMVDARIAAPDYKMLKLPRDEFTRRYRAKMSRNMEPLLQQAADIAASNGGRRLVLLCFDRLNKPGIWCHRSILARLIEEATGQSVPELGACAPAQAPVTGELF